MRVNGFNLSNEVERMDELINIRYAALDKLDNPFGDKCINCNQVLHLNQKISNLENEVVYLKGEIDRIYHSRGWKLIRPIYIVSHKILPVGSKRRRFVHRFFNIFRLINAAKYAENRSEFLNNVHNDGFMEALKKAYTFINGYPKGVRTHTDKVEFPANIASNEVSPPKNENKYARPLNLDIVAPIVPLVFDVHENPMVSIIIPVYNQWHYTYNCLRSILNSNTVYPYEIIIADDCSTDETTHLEKYVKNVIHVRNEKNLRFLKNCNNAANYANGKYILFLNNDTYVLENWLPSLVNLIESDKTIGLVGSKFIYPDGTLQEAGGVVWSDGTGYNCGRGFHPDRAEYNYVKDADYISGASIMISKELWEQIGGFDEQFAPAYFEDSDLAFSVRKLGRRVVYQPKSEIVHFERVSSGDTMDSNAFRLMDANRPKFIKKWKHELSANSFPADTHLYLQRDRSKHKKTVLFIDDIVPKFDQHAGGKTTFNFLQLLLDLGFKITFCGDNDYIKEDPYTSILQQMGIEVLYGEEYRNGKVYEYFAKNRDYYDIVFINRPHIGKKYVKWFKEHTKATVVYYGHDLHFLREYREYELTKDVALLRKSQKSERDEIDIMKAADIVLSVSPEEKKIIDEKLGQDKTIVTPIFFYKDFLENELDPSNKKGLMFVGGYGHTPNLDAAKWFLTDIFPLIQKELPDIKVTFAGSNPPEDLLSLQSDSVHITGYLSEDELTSLYHNSRICIIPLRFGAGVKGKLVDAMYHGMSIVSTSIGLEGLSGIENYLLPYDDAQSFAKEVIRLYKDDELIKSSYSKNIEYVKNTLSYASALNLFKNIFGNGQK